MSEVLIKGAHGGRIDVGKGQILEVINVEGIQPCDFWAFNRDDVEEALSPAHIRMVLRRLDIRVGDVLVSRYLRSMLEILEDECGRHDIIIPPCDPVRYEQRFGLKNHRSCRTNLAEVMADKNIPYAYLPDAVNLFQDTRVMPDGPIMRFSSQVKAGTKVVFRALQDLIAVGSACPMVGPTVAASLGMSSDEITHVDRKTDIRFVVHQ